MQSLIVARSHQLQEVIEVRHARIDLLWLWQMALHSCGAGIDQHGLPFIDEPPRRGETQLSLIGRKAESPLLLRRYSSGRHRPCQDLDTHGRSSADTKVESSKGRVPYHLAEPQSRRSPVVLDDSGWVIPPKPRRKIIHLVAVGEMAERHTIRRSCALAPKEPLNLCLVADFALVKPDHVAFIKNEKANVV